MAQATGLIPCKTHKKHCYLAMKTRFNNTTIQQYNNKGFTLLELVIVFSVISILSTVGIASFVGYSRAQSLQSAASSLESTLNLGKSHANSQVKPSLCSTETLSGYQVDILSDTTYSLSVVCLGAHTILTTTLPDNGNIKFNLGAGQTTTTSVFFPVITSGVKGAGAIVLTGYGQTKTVTVDRVGNVK
ncbi:MAG: prepilin-type N-terminal cleavage/methylation domain-containing protein [Patescibacteria group bacterium]|nr:prepilin-type N-terminal cleavage/methylation domain-containing protein [Patescibacteria group bacterium]